MSLLAVVLVAPALTLHPARTALRPQPARGPLLQPRFAAAAARPRGAIGAAAAAAAGGVWMQEGLEREKKAKKGGAAVVERPKAEPKQMSKEEIANEPMWRLLIHNDDVHTWDYVIYAIVSVVKTVTRKKAHRITTTVHTMGSATVTITWKQQAKKYCMELQKWGLTSSIAPESDGDKGPGGGGDGGGGGGA
ncbi:hypothetical protein EMIHUDRAFT_455525 [Emiliania huxleyi CCMP1516]|uniref:Adaptor protein ClpS core domain-containing protein n=2 Tax=Emiliania huxleyi TaxID=2903 RepID=A0A0D3KFT0_EMIH1|nr:hypothetical protein EMIHUDRAFT_455525 [Emiliania huxleyi CCMP1516]EOD34615.1 hypothetical protein EMIHUDRAFT_455525 [Emiliania huxleyi CCMP1516]|eukprot:XP_005787044.1 hypothetical protein EMIHUDRAFT_455525 [Emiliania huxleyi CCMP1516]